eukprot:CAMPEP_0204086500 /NCGR_PEP_ID=MMETSP0360-20130528/183171_1 /ASSEMBLY_ACC=CAM_ASM_000342 /TAXON_ID=268821 /ORGANISM="Scrippsiella Hangoei, Strain SHTV-5" /LENGTH=57 /DNA_ID=CAMNT_0051035601 /DNA_START=99 /DNA_END=272 /DNA_ORIENTATION=+
MTDTALCDGLRVNLGTTTSNDFVLCVCDNGLRHDRQGTSPIRFRPGTAEESLASHKT